MLKFNNIPEETRKEYEKLSGTLCRIEELLDKAMRTCVIVKEKLMDIRNLLGNAEQTLRELPNSISYEGRIIYYIDNVDFLNYFRNTIANIDSLLSKMMKYIDKIHKSIVEVFNLTVQYNDNATKEVFEFFNITLPNEEKMKTIISIIEDLVKKNNHKPVRIEDVLREAEKKGITSAEAEKLLNLLIKSGEVYTPKPGYIKTLKI